MEDIGFFDWVLFMSAALAGLWLHKSIFLTGCRVGFEKGWDACEEYARMTEKAKREWDNLNEDDNG